MPSPTALIVGKGAIGPAAPPPPAISNDYELKVRNFLSEMNRDEDNYEEKVRRFVEETSKYRKDREKASEKKKRRKKEKETKRTKKESKKKKREKSGKKDKKSKGSGAAATATDSTMGDEDKLREALKCVSFPGNPMKNAKFKCFHLPFQNLRELPYTRRAWFQIAVAVREGQEGGEAPDAGTDTSSCCSGEQVEDDVC